MKIISQNDNKKKDKKKEKEQILIEDGTLAAFGITSNPSEINVRR